MGGGCEEAKSGAAEAIVMWQVGELVRKLRQMGAGIAGDDTEGCARNAGSCWATGWHDK